MANRWFTQFTKSLEKAPIHIFMRATFAASSAVTLDTANSKGVASIVKTGTGDFTITLSDNYVRLFCVSAVWDQSGVSATPNPAAPIVAIKGQTVTTVGGGTLELLCSAAAGGSGTDPDTGSALLLDIILSNSTAF